MTTSRDHASRWAEGYIKKLMYMFLFLFSGIGCAVGQHLFYHSLAGHTPSSSKLAVKVWTMSEEISTQELNTAIGNTLAFFTKSFLASAIALSHDQVSWRIVKTRITKLGLIDALFTSRDSVASALTVRLWWQMPFASILLLAFWLQPLAQLISPSALSLHSITVNTTNTTTVPRVDFTSMNFAFVDFLVGLAESSQEGYIDCSTDEEFRGIDYENPQYAVKRATQASLLSGSISTISPPRAQQNASWTITFNGPALECRELGDNDTLKIAIINSVEINGTSAESSPPYLSWVPATDDNGVNGSLPFTQQGVFRTGSVGGYPLSLYMMVVPLVEDSTPARASQGTILKCELHNVTYTVDFTYTNGQQNIRVTTGPSLGTVSYLGGYTNCGEPYTNYVPGEPAASHVPPPVSLNQTGVEILAYQAVMDSFSSMFVGSFSMSEAQSFGSVPFRTYLVGSATSMSSSMVLTAAMQAKELSDIERYFNLHNSNLTDQGYVTWNGSSASFQNDTSTRPLEEMMVEMFQNITISLMSEPSLNPNYSSIYAPPDVNMTTWTSQIVYQYSAKILWIPYGIAIVISTITVLAAAIVILQAKAAYSSQFSTFLRVRETIALADGVEIDLKDTSGKDPLPKYLEQVAIHFTKKSEVSSPLVGGHVGGGEDLEMEDMRLL